MDGVKTTTTTLYFLVWNFQILKQVKGCKRFFLIFFFFVSTAQYLDTLNGRISRTCFLLPLFWTVQHFLTKCNLALSALYTYDFVKRTREITSRKSYFVCKSSILKTNQILDALRFFWRFTKYYFCNWRPFTFELQKYTIFLSIFQSNSLLSLGVKSSGSSVTEETDWEEEGAKSAPTRLVPDRSRLESTSSIQSIKPVLTSLDSALSNDFSDTCSQNSFQNDRRESFR